MILWRFRKRKTVRQDEPLRSVDIYGFCVVKNFGWLHTVLFPEFNEMCFTALHWLVQLLSFLILWKTIISAETIVRWSEDRLNGAFQASREMARLALKQKTCVDQRQAANKELTLKSNWVCSIQVFIPEFFSLQVLFAQQGTVVVDRPQSDDTHQVPACCWSHEIRKARFVHSCVHVSSCVINAQDLPCARS